MPIEYILIFALGCIVGHVGYFLRIVYWAKSLPDEFEAAIARMRKLESLIGGGSGS